MSIEFKKSRGNLSNLNIGEENEQASKEDIQILCEHLKLPFNRDTAMALIYGDNMKLPERILPSWLSELL